jgi:hypothetical protein
MACAGDSTSTCGGFYYINIVSLPTTSTSTGTGSSGTYTSLGCYTDSGSPRLLNGASTTSSSMTAAVCSSFCSSSGYTYFGTEYSTEVSAVSTVSVLLMLMIPSATVATRSTRAKPLPRAPAAPPAAETARQSAEASTPSASTNPGRRRTRSPSAATLTVLPLAPSRDPSRTSLA